MSKEKIFIFDTTLRDGAQTEGVDFSVNDKVKIAERLNKIGVDYIEGGWPGANPTDTEYFNTSQQLDKSIFTAFGMTKKSGRSADNDPTLAPILNANTKAVCIVGKSWDFHVDVALGITKKENLENIKETAKNALSAVLAGARQIQGTINGLGERCGNANIMSVIPTLFLKKTFSDKFELNFNKEQLSSLTDCSRMLDEILNRKPNKSLAYVGASAFSHKGGLHVSAVKKDPKTYEHIEPKVVGNHRNIIVSDQAGKSNILSRLEGYGIKINSRDPKIQKILEEVKDREFSGYSYDGADASFELLANRLLGKVPDYLKVESYSVTVEKSQKLKTNAEVIFLIDGKKIKCNGSGNGPVNALDNAIRENFSKVEKYYNFFSDLKLLDYKVRILNTGTEATTRVLIESTDKSGKSWFTIGVSPNIIEASFKALIDSLDYKLFKEKAPANLKLDAK